MLYLHKETGTLIAHETLMNYVRLDHEYIAFRELNPKEWIDSLDVSKEPRLFFKYRVKDIPFNNDFEKVDEIKGATLLDLEGYKAILKRAGLEYTPLFYLVNKNIRALKEMVISK